MLWDQDPRVVEDDSRKILQLQPFMYEIADSQGTNWSVDCADDECDVTGLTDCSDCDRMTTRLLGPKSAAGEPADRGSGTVVGAASARQRSFKLFAFYVKKRLNASWRLISRNFVQYGMFFAKRATLLLGAAMLLASIAAAMLGFNT